MADSTFDALEAAGMERRQAEAAAEQLRFAAGAARDRLATKANIDRLRTATKAGLANAVNRMLIARIAVTGCCSPPSGCSDRMDAPEHPTGSLIVALDVDGRGPALRLANRLGGRTGPGAPAIALRAGWGNPLRSAP